MLNIRLIHDYVGKQLRDLKNRINLNAEIVLVLANVFLVMLALNLFSNNLGPSDIYLNRAIGFLALLGCLIMNISRPETIEKAHVIYGVLFIVTSMLLIFIPSNNIFWLAGLSGFVFGMVVLLRGFGKSRPELHMLSLATFAYALFFILMLNVAPVYYFIVKISLLFSNFVGQMIGIPSLFLGPTISGTFIFIGFLFLILSNVILCVNKKWMASVMAILALAIANVLWIIIHALYFSSDTVSSMANLWIPFVMILIPSILFTVLTRKIIPTFDLFGVGKLHLKKSVAICISVLFILLIVATTNAISTQKSNGNVIIYKRDMLANLDRATYGNYGMYAGGMFGLLTEYLNSSGYSANFYNGTINETMLSKTSIFVIINLGRYFNDTEHDAIWNFVQHGGSLLVLGDHTDMGGMMNHSNRLLAPVGIRYSFDAALPANEIWINSIQAISHPITKGIEMQKGVGISVGASLTIDDAFKANPLIVGRYGFSDHGNYQNGGRNAFLGDYKYNIGEQLGDVILAAYANYGKGKVVVFGDTSPLQNTAWPFSYKFANSILNWLNENKSSGIESNGVSVWILLASVTVLAVIMWLLRKKFGLAYHVLSVFAVCFVLVFSASANSILVMEPQMTGDIAYIDSSHNDIFSSRGFNDDSIDGLIFNLMRNDYLPIIGETSFKNSINNSKMAVFIAPASRFTKTETNFLLEYMSNGGLIVVSCGWMEKEGALPLLNALGLDISNQPMGPVPYTEKDPQKYIMEPKFMDAWPILVQNASNVSTFYKISIENESYNLMVFKQHGTGGLLLISDSRFLLNKNLESKDEYWPGNIQFFKDALDKLKQMGALS